MEIHAQTSLNGVLPLAPLLVLGAILFAYLAAAIRPRRQPRPWSRRRTAWFTVGIGLLALTLSPPLERLAHHDIRGHMIQHLLIGMFAPLGLVLAAPVTLALRTLPVRAARFVTTTLGSRPLRWIAHPATALILNVGGMYLLYLTPIYLATLTNSYLHQVVQIHFLVAGSLFAWAIAGPDSAPHRPGPLTRLIVLFLGIAAHATLAKVMYAYLLPRGTSYSDDQIRAAAQLMYYGGDLAELLLAVVLFSTWYRVRNRRQSQSVITDLE